MYRAARVFDVHGPRYLFKEYGPTALDRLDQEALERLVTWRSRLRGRGGRAILSHCALPSELVTFEGTVRGFLMPEAPSAYLWTTPEGSVAEQPDGARIARTGDELGRQIRHKNAALDIEYQTYSTAHQFGLLGHLLTLTNTLHRGGIVLSDLQPKNFLVTVHSVRPSIYFVDCDSFSLDGRAPIAGLEPESWQTQAGPGRHDRLTDYAKFALLVVRAVCRDWWAPPEFDRLDDVVSPAEVTLLRRMWDLDPSVTVRDLATLSRWMRSYEFRPRHLAGPLRRVPPAISQLATCVAPLPSDGLAGYELVNPQPRMLLRSSHGGTPMRRFHSRPHLITSRRLALGFLLFGCLVAVLAVLGLVRI